MKLVLLSGNSIQNKEWIEEIKDSLNPYFDEVYLQDYKHWQEGKALIDFNFELNTLIEKVGKWEEFVIFAKSVGTALATKSILEGKIKPQKCIFVGTPVFWTDEHNIALKDWLKNYSIPTLFIQKTSDPVFHFSDLKKLLEENEVKNYQLVELPGDTHHYEDIEKLKELTLDFINRM